MYFIHASFHFTIRAPFWINFPRLVFVFFLFFFSGTHRCVICMYQRSQINDDVDSSLIIQSLTMVVTLRCRRRCFCCYCVYHTKNIITSGTKGKKQTMLRLYYLYYFNVLCLLLYFTLMSHRDFDYINSLARPTMN